MKLTNREMADIQSALTEIGNKEIDCLLGVDIARNNYELSKMLNPVEKEKQKLLERYAKKDETGKLITKGNGIILEDAAKYSEEYDRLMEADAEVELKKFTMEEVKKMSPTPNQIMKLFPIIIEEEK